MEAVSVQEARKFARTGQGVQARETRREAMERSGRIGDVQLRGCCRWSGLLTVARGCGLGEGGPGVETPRSRTGGTKGPLIPPVGAAVWQAAKSLTIKMI